MWRFLLAMGLALGGSTAHLSARGGGGCVSVGTLIDTPTGPHAIESIRAGDAVWSELAGQRIEAVVQAVYAVEPNEFIELTTEGHTLRVTPEHPVQTAPGVFTCADQLTPATALFSTWDRAPLSGLRRFPTTQLAYNLLVAPGGVYFANGLLVHNKGCFLPDTPITLANGESRAIGQIHQGDIVLAFNPDGLAVPATVHRILTHEVSAYLVVRTVTTVLHVTEEHPFYVGAGVFKTIESLHTGDFIQAFDGASHFTPQRILSMERRIENVTVYNLEVDAPHTFIASGIAVHNKGGSSGDSFSSDRSLYTINIGGGSSDPIVLGIFAGCVLIIVIVKFRENMNSSGIDEDLDYCFKRSEIEAKAAKTEKLIDFIAKVDDAVSPEHLKQTVRGTFLLLQKCWQAREFTPMQVLLMPDLYEQQCAQLRGLKQTHEINRIEDPSIEHIDLIHLNYADDKHGRWFAALLTAWVRDYYVDDSTGNFLRGDETAARFQEFWIFQLHEGTWRLREIEQSRESNLLHSENFFESFTETGRDQVYGQTAGKAGPSGPNLPEDVQAKDANIDRLLNFLVKTDRIWDREAMIATARRSYMGVLLAWQDGRPDAFTGIAATAEMLAHWRSVNESNQLNHWCLEYRNLCVRKIEIVHVNNRNERSEDEFTPRISAHAQVISTQNGTVRYQDEFVRPWIEFWTFSREGTLWILKEILPAEKGAAMLALENTDEGSSQEMLQWYYSKERAT